jgi:hypothetical protein
LSVYDKPAPTEGTPPAEKPHGKGKGKKQG